MIQEKLLSALDSALDTVTLEKGIEIIRKNYSNFLLNPKNQLKNPKTI